MAERSPAPAASSNEPGAVRLGARLRYVTDSEPGFRRQRRGKGFIFLRPDGRRIAQASELKRIQALAIPPAWTKVWISPHSEGHIQATGRDARGRKQYRYHARWQELRGEDKFSRLPAFGTALPRLRRTLRRHLRLRGLPREKVLAAVVRLLDLTGARVGNEEYARANGSFGLSTLRNRHASFSRGDLKLTFRAKSGIEYRSSIRSPRLARVVRRCQELPGQQLFQYQDDDGGRRSVTSADVNDFLRQVTGVDCSAKDFRTWRGSVEALAACRELPEPASSAEGERQIVGVVDRVAKSLGNTRAVARKHYIHPAVLAAYLEGTIPARRDRPRRELSAAERDLLSFLGGAKRRSRSLR
jgi:DNA topoisomerase-1